MFSVSKAIKPISAPSNSIDIDAIAIKMDEHEIVIYKKKKINAITVKISGNANLQQMSHI